MTKEPMKKLIVEISADKHKQIKQIAVDKNISMKTYVMWALHAQLKKDFDLGFK